jgi:hypothetical protein
MALPGLDKDQAPPAAKAKAMLEEIQGTWWNVYIGGPGRTGAGMSWTPKVVREYVAHGITRFLLTYVGRQTKQVQDLTTSNGRHDGDEACQIAKQFGFGAGAPICLDVEGKTFDASPQGSLDYACGWCEAVRARGLRPGVYSNPRALIPLADRPNGPDWVWVAAFITTKFDPTVDPHDNPKLPGQLFSKVGQRAWQYGGKIHEKPALVGGVEVDISIADSDCIAVDAGLAPGGLSMADVKDILDAISKLDQKVDNLYRRANHGEANVPTTDDFSRKGLRKDHDKLEASITALATKVDEVKTQLGAHSHP